MFNWIKKMFGAGAKEQVFVSKPKVTVTKTVTKPIIGEATAPPNMPVHKIPENEP